MVPGTGCSSIGSVLLHKLGGEYIPKVDIYSNGNKIVCHKHTQISELVKYNLLNVIDLGTYLKFATIRNPFDIFATEYQRIVGDWTENWVKSEKEKEILLEEDKSQRELYFNYLSKWAKKAKKNVSEMGFEAWLAKRLGIPKNQNSLIFQIKFQVRKLISPYYKSKAYPLISGVDTIIRFENLEEDFNNILKRAGVIRQNEWIDIPKTNPTHEKKPYQEYYTPAARALVEKYLARELKIFNYKFN